MQTLVAFVASWSQTSNELRETAQTFLPALVGDVALSFSDVSDEPLRHKDAGIRIYPTLVAYWNGVEVRRQSGPIDLIQLVNLIKETNNE